MVGTSIRNQILPTRNSQSLPEHGRDTTIQYLRWIRRVEGKATLGFVMSVSQFARPRGEKKKKNFSQCTDFCGILY